MVKLKQVPFQEAVLQLDQGELKFVVSGRALVQIQSFNWTRGN